MNDQLPELLYPCMFELARACQLAVGRLYGDSLGLSDLPFLFASVPPPRSQPGAMLAAETLNRFVQWFGRTHHDRFHERNKRVRCKFHPDQSYKEIHVNGLDWQTLDIHRCVRTWLDRYCAAFAAAHGRDLAAVAIAYLEKPNGQGIEQLARELCCSPSTLRRHCKALTGAPPIRSRTYRRLLGAFDLLRTTSWKIEAIAAAVGWKSATGVYAACDTLLGMTPAQIRQLPADTAAQARWHLSQWRTTSPPNLSSSAHLGSADTVKGHGSSVGRINLVMDE